MFYVGQKVVAVTAPEGHDHFVVPKWAHLKITEPVVGQIYTVRGFILSTKKEEYLYVEEIINERMNFKGDGLIEPAWPVLRFRPLVERKTDISIFERLLNPSKQTEDA